MLLYIYGNVFLYLNIYVENVTQKNSLSRNINVAVHIWERFFCALLIFNLCYI